MKAMIILRGYGEPQKLLARTLLIRSPKRKSVWMFQTVINSIFQQCEKETLSDLAAEESDCTRRALPCSAASPRSKGHDGHQRGPPAVLAEVAGQALSAGAPFLLPTSLCSAAQHPPHRQLHWGQHPARSYIFQNVHFLSTILSQKKKFFWVRYVSSLILVLMLQFVGVFQQKF